MPHIVCSICSRQKSQEAGVLPARQRYLGTHVAAVGLEAQKQGLPFFILSGRFGLVPADEPIPDYDYLLAREAVPELAHRISGQLVRHGVQGIHFYTKDKPNWSPYLEALQKATGRSGVSLVVCLLGEND